MRIWDNENVKPFDVDGCLIVDKSESKTHAHVYDGVSKRTIKVGVNKAMVRLLLEEHHRGAHIIVWSRSGKEWAANVVRALCLEDKVHDVLAKPTVYFDNEPVKNWMKDRVFIGPDIKYKE